MLEVRLASRTRSVMQGMTQCAFKNSRKERCGREGGGGWSSTHACQSTRGPSFPSAEQITPAMSTDAPTPTPDSTAPAKEELTCMGSVDIPVDAVAYLIGKSGATVSKGVSPKRLIMLAAVQTVLGVHHTALSA